MYLLEAGGKLQFGLLLSATAKMRVDLLVVFWDIKEEYKNKQFTR